MLPAAPLRRLPQLTMMGAGPSTLKNRTSRSSHAAGEGIDLTNDDDDQSSTARPRKRLKLILEQPSTADPMHDENLFNLFAELRIAASTSFELLEPLAMLQDWHASGPTPTKRYQDAALVLIIDSATTHCTDFRVALQSLKRPCRVCSEIS